MKLGLRERRQQRAQQARDQIIDSVGKRIAVQIVDDLAVSADTRSATFHLQNRDFRPVEEYCRAVDETVNRYLGHAGVSERVLLDPDLSYAMTQDLEDLKLAVNGKEIRQRLGAIAGVLVYKLDPEQIPGESPQFPLPEPVSAIRVY